jgi:hypothetical protein
MHHVWQDCAQWGGITMKAVAGITFIVWSLGVPLLLWWIATSIFREVRHDAHVLDTIPSVICRR